MFKVTELTIRNWIRDHENFYTAIKKGRRFYLLQEVEASLVKRAKGFTITKQRTEVDSNGKTKIIKEDVYYPPDVGACCFLAKNWNPQEWKDYKAQIIDVNYQNEKKIVVEQKSNDIDELIDSLGKEKVMQLANIIEGKSKPAGSKSTN